MVAKDIMETDVFTVSSSSPMAAAASMILEENIGALVVVDVQKRLAGIITDRDIRA